MTQNVAYEIQSRLSILDITTFMGSYDDWYPSLRTYVEAILKVVLDAEPESSPWPAPETVQALAAVTRRCNPTKIHLDIEKAIRMEFSDFNQKWDALLMESKRPIPTVFTDCE